MPRVLDRAAASASFAARIRALLDEGVLCQDEGDAFLADLAAQADRPKDDPVRVQTLTGVGRRLCALFVADEITMPAFGPLIGDLLDIAEYVPGADP